MQFDEKAGAYLLVTDEGTAEGLLPWLKWSVAVIVGVLLLFYDDVLVGATASMRT